MPARIPPTRSIWKDGELIPWGDATVHLLSTAVQFGASLFEGIRCYETPRGPAIFQHRAHERQPQFAALRQRSRVEPSNSLAGCGIGALHARQQVVDHPGARLQLPIRKELRQQCPHEHIVRLPQQCHRTAFET